MEYKGYTPWRRIGSTSSVLPKEIMIMKKLLLLAGVVALLSTTGCLVSEGEWHGHSRGHERYERHDEVIVGPPAVVVRVPEVVLRPPEVIVR